MTTLIGTADGLHVLDSDQPAILAGHRIDALARGDGLWWILTDATTVWSLPDGTTPSRAVGMDEVRLNCLLALRDEVLLGAEAAQLFHLPSSAGKAAKPTLDEPFQHAPGRDEWYTS